MDEKDIEWAAIRQKFYGTYDERSYTNSLQSIVMRAGHKFSEKPFSKKERFDRVLEIGAGTGQHLPFVRHQFSEYILSDMDTETLSVAKEKYSKWPRKKLSFQILSGDKLPYKDQFFDRLIAAHVLEHIYYPHKILQEWQRVIKYNGVLSILIPTDPGLVWRLGQKFGPRSRANDLDIPYDYVNAREHVNSCNNLIAILRHYFPGAKEAWWPTRIPSVDLNLFFIAHITVHSG